MKKYTPKLVIQPISNLPKVYMDEGEDAFSFSYVPAELAEEMLKVLKDLIQWEEIDQHSDDDMIAVLKYEAIINQAKSIITKAEEE